MIVELAGEGIERRLVLRDLVLEAADVVLDAAHRIRFEAAAGGQAREAGDLSTPGLFQNGARLSRLFLCLQLALELGLEIHHRRLTVALPFVERLDLLLLAVPVLDNAPKRRIGG